MIEDEPEAPERTEISRLLFETLVVWKLLKLAVTFIPVEGITKGTLAKNVWSLGPAVLAWGVQVL